jgi:hypothetical protein
MRSIKTFVLRLYFDVDAPERLCGNIRSLEDTDNHPFKNQIEFEEVLHRLIREPPRHPTIPPEVDLYPDE